MLSILIPSRNRTHRIDELLANLVNVIPKEYVDNIEIVVSENNETSGYHEIIAKYPQLKIIHLSPASTFLTAEEHLFWAWQFTTKEYVWILGDDDPVIKTSFLRLLKILSDEKPNALFWNSNLLHPSGIRIRSNRIPCESSELELTIVELAERAGIWYALSGFSTWIIKRDLLDWEKAQLWVNNSDSPIYSHVTYFLQALARFPIKFVNEPLVDYRMNYSDLDDKDNNWRVFADSTGAYFRKPWLSGFLSQIEELVNSDVVPPNFLDNMIEQRHDGTRLPFVEIFVNLLIEQLLRGNRVPNERIPKSDFIKIMKFLRENNPHLETYWRSIEKTHSSQLSPSFNKLKRVVNNVEILKCLSWWNFIFENFRFQDRVRPNSAVMQDIRHQDVLVKSVKDYQFIDFGFSLNVQEVGDYKALISDWNNFVMPPKISNAKFYAAAILPHGIKKIIKKLIGSIRALVS